MYVMLRIYIQDSLCSSQVKLFSTRVLRRSLMPSMFNSSIGHGSRLHNICPLDNPLWYIDIALKLGPQLNISTAIFLVFG